MQRIQAEIENIEVKDVKLLEAKQTEKKLKREIKKIKLIIQSLYCRIFR